MQAGGTPTLPLTPEEYKRLMEAVYVIVKAPQNYTVENQGTSTGASE